MAEVGDVRSAGRVLSILLFLASRAVPVQAAVIARDCSLPRSSTYRLLNVMCSRGFVIYSQEDRAWGLGPAAFEMMAAYLRSQPLELLGRPTLRMLSTSTGEVAHLAVLHGREVLYLLKEQPPGPGPRLVTEIGVRLPARRTSVGRAILMHLSPSQLRALYPPEASRLDSEDAGGVMLLSDLERILRAERAQGYAVDDGETTSGVSCIGAAVFDHRRRPVAAVNVTFLSDSHDEASRAELAAEVCAAANRMSQSWGAPDTARTSPELFGAEP